MNIRKHATKIVTAGLALAIAVPTVAMAAHPFTDVPEDQWYSDAVDWAYDNDLTTGKTPTTFNGFDTTNRYEVVTFMNRYHDNMVVPALSDLGDDIDDTVEMQFGMFDSSTNTSSATADPGLAALLELSTEVTIPEGYEGVIANIFSAETRCTGGAGWCGIQILVDGDDITPNQTAMDSSDNGTEGLGSYESHAVQAVSDVLNPGTYTITVRAYAGADVTFYLDDMTLTSQVHLTGEDDFDIGFGLLSE